MGFLTHFLDQSLMTDDLNYRLLVHYSGLGLNNKLKVHYSGHGLNYGLEKAQKGEVMN